MKIFGPHGGQIGAIDMKIGEIIPMEREITLNEGRNTRKISVSNIGDRPIQVGSHYHFFEVNRLLKFEREKAFGYRLDIPSGTSVRFEPGEEKQVMLVELGGKKCVFGCNDLTCGPVVGIGLKKAMHEAEKKNMI